MHNKAEATQKGCHCHYCFCGRRLPTRSPPPVASERQAASLSRSSRSFLIVSSTGKDKFPARHFVPGFRLPTGIDAAPCRIAFPPCNTRGTASADKSDELDV